ncbi:hypothetical protein HS125_17645 [bacterium]|nr:hypothetical protein [bacterium]
MRIRYHLVIIILAAVAIFGVVGAGAADYAVGAPGTPAQNSTNIQAAINSALGDAGPNRVLLQSGQTYVVDARLLISGTAKSVTITSDGATKAILVGSNFTTTADSHEGVFTVTNLVNSSLGFENFTLLPPAFSVTGSSPAVGNTNGIGIAETCTGSSFHFVNMLITGNNNANGPLSTDGTGNIGGFTNPTVFGYANINVADTNATAALNNSFYLTNVVSSHANISALHIGGTLDVGGAFTVNNTLRLINCTFGTSIAGRLVDVAGLTNVSVTNSFGVGTIPDDALRVANCYNLNINGFTATQFVVNGIDILNVQTANVRNASLTDSFTAISTAHRNVTMFLVDAEAAFRVLNPTVTMTDCYIGDTAAQVNAVHMYWQRAVTATRVTIKDLTYQTPTNPPILIAMWFENCQEVTLDGCLIQNLQNPTLNCSALDFTYTGLPNPASQSDPNPTPRNFTIRNTTIRDVTLGIFPRAHYVGLIENCVFENFDGHIFSERNGFGRSNNPANVNWGRRSTTIRDCTFTNINHHQLNPTQNTDTYRNGFYMLDDVVTFERVILTGPTTPVANVWWGVWMVDPLQATFTDCFFAGWNRAAVRANLCDTPNVLANPADIARAELRFQNCYLLGNGHNLGVPVRDQTPAAGHEFAPISLLSGYKLVVNNTVIEDCGGDAIHALFVTNSPVNCATATAQLNDVTFVNCRDNLFTVSCDPNQTNVVDVNGVWTTGNPMLQTPGGVPALWFQNATANVRNLFVTGWAGPVLENRYFGANAGTYTLEDVMINTVGQNAIQMNTSWNGELVVNRADIRNVTAGSGISVQGGGVSMNDVVVVNAARYGVSVGEATAPVAGPMRVGTLSRLALVGNTLGGIRFVQGDNTKPTMTLTDSTILGSPVGISYEEFNMQRLAVTDSIITGMNGTGVGIDVPNLVVGTGSPAPRVQVSNSALTTDNVNGRGLASAVVVGGGNPGGTVTQTAVIPSDPIFISIDPDNPGFVDVDSSYFGDKGTGGTPLSGYGDYIGGTVGIGGWRLY